ncbi:hypothetical protein LVJ94_44945 [Pendulispora rubella]|uniref:Uncharacterized protein n=1 Tax=Pendulispora rubella TaxID=2741070 RepID=A0ABZ2KZC9_9BACT
MAFAVTGGHQVSPAPVADALVRIAKACPELDSLAKTDGYLRLRLKVQSNALHPAETPSEPLASCAAKAVEGAPIPGAGDTGFAMADIRAATSKDKGAKE